MRFPYFDCIFSMSEFCNIILNEDITYICDVFIIITCVLSEELLV